jgi:Derlin-2/3
MAPFINIHFLGSSLTFMMVYLWSQRNQHLRVAFFFVPFPAPYLPWVLLGLSLLFGNSPVIDLMGISVGHIYFFLEDVLPEVARIRGWRLRRFLPTPHAIKGLCAAPRRRDNNNAADADDADAPRGVGGGGRGGGGGGGFGLGGMYDEDEERRRAGLPPLGADDEEEEEEAQAGGGGGGGVGARDD